MAYRHDAELVSFDADHASEHLQSAAGDDLLVVAEYTPDDHQLLYVSEELAARYGSVDDVLAAASSIHEYIDLDFRERDLFLDLYPTIEEVEALVTVTAERSVVRVLSPREEGLYFSVDQAAPVMELVEAVVEIVDRKQTV